MSKKVRNSFIQGMDKDSAKSKYTNTKYYRGVNIKLLTEEGLSTGNIENEDGTTLSFKLPDLAPVMKIQFLDPEEPTSDTLVINYRDPVTNIIVAVNVTAGDIETLFINLNSALQILIDANLIKFINSGNYITLITYGDYNTIFQSLVSSTYIIVEEVVPAITNLKIIGWGTLRDDLVLFTTSSESETPAGTDGQIWKISYNLSTNQIDNASIDTLNPYYHLMYNNILNFSTYYHIGTEVIGHYETSKIGRVYWTDEYNSLRSANLLDPNLLGVSPSTLSINSDYKTSIPIITNITPGGSIPSGVTVQYGYRLGRTTNQFTTISPISNPTPLGAFHPMLGTPGNRYWESWGTNTGGGPGHTITYEIKGIDTSYNLIQHIAVVTSNTGVSIYRFKEETVPQDGTLTVIHDGPGDNIPFTPEEFSFISKTFKRCKTITVKDKRLIAGNLWLDSPIVENFDARAYRFNSARLSKITDNERATIEFNGVDYKYTSNPLLDWTDIPFDYDAINPYNDEYSTTWASDQYIYQANGVTVGGQGPNISYKFVKKTIQIKDKISGISSYGGINAYDPASCGRITTADRNSELLNGEKVLIVNDYKSFKGASVCTHFKGYAKGEIYRFGITFFDLSGNPFETKWIADIKFPPASNSNSIGKQSGGTIVADISGIEFNVDISGIKSEISGFEIVRVERTLTNRSKLGTGILAPYVVNVHGYGPRRRSYSHGTTNYQDGFAAQGPGGNMGPITARLLDRYQYSTSELGVTHGFLSPITYFDSTNQYWNPTAGDKIRTLGFLEDLYEAGDTPFPVNSDAGSGINDYQKATVLANSVGYRILHTIGTPAEEIRDVVGQPILIPNGASIGPGTFTITGGYGLENNSTTVVLPTPPLVPIELWNSGYGCQKGILELASKFTYYTTSGGQDPYYQQGWRIVSYERKLVNQYGGNTYEARSKNTYIATGGFKNVDGSTANIISGFQVYGGDVYNQYFASQYFSYKWGLAEAKYMYGLGFPCETPVNVEYQSDLSDLAFGNDAMRFAWQDGAGIGLSETHLVQPASNFYNSLYSKNNTAKLIYFPKGFLEDYSVEFPHRLWASEKKLDGELFDSWRTFLTNNFSEVEGMYGQINKIITEGDTFMFYQDTAMGIAGINDRTSVPSTDGTSIVLGKGGILDSYKYISRKTGTKHKFSVVPSSTGIHHFDSNLMKWFRYGQGVEPLSDMKGLHSEFKTFDGNLLSSDRILKGRGIHGTFDRVRNKVYMTFLDAKKDFIEPFPASEIITNTSSNLITVVSPGIGKNKIYIGDYVKISGSCFLVTSTLGIHQYYFNNQEYLVEEVLSEDSISINLGFSQTISFVPQLNTDVIIYNKRFDYTVSFNENLGAFESEYDFHPRLYLENSGNLFSVPQNLIEGWRHYDGPKNTFYNYTYPSIVELIIAPDSDITKVFDNIEYKGEVFIRDVDQSNLTIQEAQVLNDHQDSGRIALTVGQNIIRRLRSWRLNVFRDSKSPRGDARMRDYYIKLILKHTPRMIPYNIVSIDTQTQSPYIKMYAPNIGADRKLIGSKVTITGNASFFIPTLTTYTFSGEYLIHDITDDGHLVVDLGVTNTLASTNQLTTNVVVNILSNERMVLHDIITTYRYSNN